MKEKRKDPRFEARVSIKYRMADGPDSKWQAGTEVKNVSMGGIMFSAFEKLPVGTPLVFKIQIFIEDSAVKILELKASVVAVEDGIVSYDTRANFTGLDHSKQTALKEFIDYLGK